MPHNDVLGEKKLGEKKKSYHALEHFSEHNMPPVQPLRLLGGEEELRPVSVLASIGHGQPASPIMLQLEVLICKLFSVDAAPCNITE